MTEKSHNQFCTFYLKGQFFGIDVERVQEIIRFQDITPVALAPAVIRGLINLRGQIVTAIDLRRVLGMDERGEDELPMNIVVRTDEGAFSLLVDRIGDVLDLDDSLCEAPPSNIKRQAQKLIKRAYKLEGALLLSLEVNELVSRSVLTDTHSAAA